MTSRHSAASRYSPNSDMSGDRMICVKLALALTKINLASKNMNSVLVFAAEYHPSIPASPA